MKLPRRKFLHLAAGAAALPAKVDALSDRSNPASRHFAWGKLWQPRDGAGLAR